MNEYRIRNGTFNWDGEQVNGWLVFDTVAAAPATATLVARILPSDSGRVFKEQLVRAGAVVEVADD
jgi:hypothetical protein